MLSADQALTFARQALVIACVCWVAALCAGAAVRHREGAAGIAVRMLATLIVPATWLAFSGLFWWPLAVGISVVSAWWQGVGSLGYLGDRAREIWRQLSVVTNVALVLFAILATMRVGAALSTPPTDGDSLLYHLPMTAAFVQDHTMWFTRALLYPAASELGGAMAAAAAQSVNATALIELVQLIALVLVGFGWARRAGASVDGAAAASVVAGTLPIVVDQSITAQNDIFVCTMVAAMCVLWRSQPRLASIAAGLLVASKLSALVLVPAVSLVMVAFEGWPFRWTDIAWVVAIAAPWYIRTWVLSGSPLYTISALGWNSTIAANMATSLGFVFKALRIYGGLAAIGGLAAVIVAALWRTHCRFASVLLWLAIAAFTAWVILPNSAESVPGTLDQIREGWSIRYAIFVLFVLATALPIVLDRLTTFPLAAFVALVAASSALVRAGNLTATDQPLGFSYALPLMFVAMLCLLALLLTGETSGSRRQILVSWGVASAAIVLWAIIATSGALCIQRLWDPSYLQWSKRLPPTTLLLDAQVRRADRIAVIGMRSFPFAGARFERRTYDDIIIQAPSAWLSDLRAHKVALLVAAGESGSPDEPGFLEPLPAERQIATQRGVCQLESRGHVRLYGLLPSRCMTSDSNR